MFVDPYSVTTPFRRPRPATPTMQLVELTQHSRRIGDRWYRDAIVLVDGQRRLMAFPEVAA